MIIKTEAFLDLLKCFNDTDEFITFRNELHALTEDMCYAFFRLEESTDVTHKVEQHIKQMFTFALFCREHFELIRDLIGKIEFEEVSQEERDALLEQNGVLDLDDDEDDE